MITLIPTFSTRMLTSTSTTGSDSNDTPFDEELQIDMKGPVGDAVGNVSGAPTSCYHSAKR
jgi:hypothetical protein